MSRSPHNKESSSITALSPRKPLATESQQASKPLDMHIHGIQNTQVCRRWNSLKAFPLAPNLSTVTIKSPRLLGELNEKRSENALYYSTTQENDLEFRAKTFPPFFLLQFISTNAISSLPSPLLSVQLCN